MQSRSRSRPGSASLVTRIAQLESKIGGSSLDPRERRRHAQEAVERGTATNRQVRLAYPERISEYERAIVFGSQFFAEQRDVHLRVPHKIDWWLDVAAAVVSYPPDADPPNHLTERLAMFLRDHHPPGKTQSDRALREAGVNSYWFELRALRAIVKTTDGLALRSRIAAGEFDDLTDPPILFGFPFEPPLMGVEWRQVAPIVRPREPPDDAALLHEM
jgi:hypothetical protein